MGVAVVPSSSFRSIKIRIEKVSLLVPVWAAVLTWHTFRLGQSKVWRTPSCPPFTLEGLFYIPHLYISNDESRYILLIHIPYRSFPLAAFQPLFVPILLTIILIHNRHFPRCLLHKFPLHLFYRPLRFKLCLGDKVINLMCDPLIIKSQFCALATISLRYFLP